MIPKDDVSSLYALPDHINRRVLQYFIVRSYGHNLGKSSGRWISGQDVLIRLSLQSALSRLLSLLSKHPDIQEKLRQEVTEARRNNNGEDLSYNELNSLPYLDAVCRESLRL